MKVVLNPPTSIQSANCTIAATIGIDTVGKNRGDSSRFRKVHVAFNSTMLEARALRFSNSRFEMIQRVQRAKRERGESIILRILFISPALLCFSLILINPTVKSSQPAGEGLHPCARGEVCSIGRVFVRCGGPWRASLKEREIGNSTRAVQMSRDN